MQFATVKALETWLRKPLGSSIGYEFGTGWTATTAILLWSSGVRRQHLVDVEWDLTRELFAHCVEQFQRLEPEQHLTAPFASSELSSYGINYHAPADATHLPFAAGSIDFITSTNTLKHIPRESLRRIFIECRRAMRSHPLMSHVIDYCDEYSHPDRSIGPYNFLRYTACAWSIYNPSSHYQNRLRHSDI